VVTRDVAPFTLVVGQPAREAGHVCACGAALALVDGGSRCACGLAYVLREGGGLAACPPRGPQLLPLGTTRAGRAPAAGGGAREGRPGGGGAGALRGRCPGARARCCLWRACLREP
jgi:hypothetical protein